MSAKITLGSTLGGLVLLIIIGVIVITGAKSNEEAAKQAAEDSAAAKAISEQLYQDQQKINQTINNFVKTWFDRVEISNKNNNESRALEARQTQNIIGNLTQHRIIQNITREDDQARQNETLSAIKHIQNVTSALTGPQYEKLADKRVDSIVGNLSADHKIIFKALNISKSDETTDAENDTENLGQLLKDFIQDQKVKQNKPQGPKS